MHRLNFISFLRISLAIAYLTHHFLFLQQLNLTEIINCKTRKTNFLFKFCNSCHSPWEFNSCEKNCICFLKLEKKLVGLVLLNTFKFVTIHLQDPEVPTIEPLSDPWSFLALELTCPDLCIRFESLWCPTFLSCSRPSIRI